MLVTDLIKAVKEGQEKFISKPEQEPVAWMVDVDLANYQGQSEYRTILAWNAKPGWSGTHEINEVLKAVPLYTSPQPAQPAQQQEPVSEAWDKGYRQGVQDERTSEANIGIAGFGAKVEPARQNPYGTSPPAQRTWVGLTDKEIEKLTVELRDIPVTLAFAIEAKLKEKNT